MTHQSKTVSAVEWEAITCFPLSIRLLLLENKWKIMLVIKVSDRDPTLWFKSKDPTTSQGSGV